MLLQDPGHIEAAWDDKTITGLSYANILSFFRLESQVGLQVAYALNWLQRYVDHQDHEDPTNLETPSAAPKGPSI